MINRIYQSYKNTGISCSKKYLKPKQLAYFEIEDKINGATCLKVALFGVCELDRIIFEPISRRS